MTFIEGQPEDNPSFESDEANRLQDLGSSRRQV